MVLHSKFHLSKAKSYLKLESPDYPIKLPITGEKKKWI